MMTEIVNGSLRMLGDRILLKPLDWNGESVHGSGSMIHVERHGRPLRGEVKAVGPGCYPNRYRTGTQDGKDWRKSYATKHFRPTEVKIGDIVELGGLNVFDGKGYIPLLEVMIGTELHIICSEKDVAIVRDDMKRTACIDGPVENCPACQSRLAAYGVAAHSCFLSDSVA